MSEIRVTTVSAGQRAEQIVTTGTKAWELFQDDPQIIAARVGGELSDLSRELADGDEVAPVPIDSDDGRAILRHSTAHVMAQAVQELFPTARLGIGPPITDGFYYDFDVSEPFKPEDLDAIETRMRKIVKEGQRFVRREVSDDDARAELAAEPYKLELVGLKGAVSAADDGADVEVGSGGLTIYDNVKRDGSVAWKDLCRGPHLPTTKRIPAFKLLRSAAAYWRGDEKNPQLQRIYGTAWESKEALDAYFERLEEAARRDHRKLGTELDLFSFPDEIGSGLAVFHPKGGMLRKVMEDYSRQRHVEADYEFVYSPHITKSALFETSGHLDWFADGMYPPMHLDEERADDGSVRKPGQDYYLKPMNCPFHCLIFRSRGRSYRELPLRLFEFGSVYRYEKSGVVHGLTRVRGMTQDDAHIYVTVDQIEAELKSLLTFVLDLLKDYRPRRLLPRAVDQEPGQGHRLRRDLGVRDRDAAQGSRRVRPRARPGSRWRRLLRPEDLRAGARCDRSHLADVHHPARLLRTGAFRARVHRRRRLEAAAGDDPPGALRVDRAVHRRAHRALRRRLPALAGARAGRRDPDRRAARGLPS